MKRILKTSIGVVFAVWFLWGEQSTPGQVAEELGVADRVHITGFLDFDEFAAAIAACDLCLNLRYPTAGETSAALLRTLALGRPTVVSDYAQFAELPSSCPSSSMVLTGFRRPRRPIRISDIMTGMPISTTQAR